MTKEIYGFLDRHNITYGRHEHHAVYTVEEANALYGDIPGIHTKNLFLRNHTATHYYLFILASHKRADLKTIAAILDEKKLHFASPEELMEYLGVTPGSVSALGLVNDTAHRVAVLIDEDVWNAAHINAHPNTNTSTLTIPRKKFHSFFTATGHTPHIVLCT